MSKKKRAAKLAKAEARKALIGGRAEAALAEFGAQFEDPYESPEEFEAEQEICLKFYREVEAFGDSAAAFLAQDEAGSRMALAEWILKFKDELVTKHRSEAIVDSRVRFQVARLFREVEGAAGGTRIQPTSLKVMATLIKRLPLFPSQGFDDPLGLADIAPQRNLSRVRNPYGKDEDAKADVELVRQAWRTQYGADALSDDFCPPMFTTDDGGVLAAPWVKEFRDLMVRKYGSLKAAETRIRYIMMGIIPEMVDRRGSGVVQTRTIEEQEQFEALVDRVDEQMHGR